MKNQKTPKRQEKEKGLLHAYINVDGLMFHLDLLIMSMKGD